MKHNQMGEDAPLAVQMDLNPTAGTTVRVGNPERPRRSTLPGAGLGLRNLNERCRLLTGRGLAVRHEAGRLEVDVPVTARLEAPAPAHEGTLQPSTSSSPKTKPRPATASSKPSPGWRQPRALPARPPRCARPRPGWPAMTRPT